MHRHSRLKRHKIEMFLHYHSQRLIEETPTGEVIVWAAICCLNVSDFGSGTTLHIKTVGSVTIQEAAEDTPLVYNPIESGEVSLQITNYVGDALTVHWVQTALWDLNNWDA